jgi:hypothetical protein
MRVSELTRPKVVTRTIELADDETITVEFDRNKVTPAWVGEARARDDAQDGLSLPKALAGLILSWDVTNDDGSPYPPTVPDPERTAGEDHRGVHA